VGGANATGRPVDFLEARTLRLQGVHGAVVRLAREVRVQVAHFDRVRDALQLEQRNGDVSDARLALHGLEIGRNAGQEDARVAAIVLIGPGRALPGATNRYRNGRFAASQVFEAAIAADTQLTRLLAEGLGADEPLAVQAAHPLRCLYEGGGLGTGREHRFGDAVRGRLHAARAAARTAGTAGTAAASVVAGAALVVGAGQSRQRREQKRSEQGARRTAQTRGMGSVHGVVGPFEGHPYGTVPPPRQRVESTAGPFCVRLSGRSRLAALHYEIRRRRPTIPRAQRGSTFTVSERSEVHDPRAQRGSPFTVSERSDLKATPRSRPAQRQAQVP
jgi:hypothetical protein